MLNASRHDNRERAAMRPLAEAVPVDRAVVARLRRAITAGAYRVDPTAIAAAMIADLPKARRRRATD